MRIISWNVAGWAPTKQKIGQLMGMKVCEYFESHAADIVCLQELKISEQKLEANGRDFGDVDGYESFWACSVDRKSIGFQGVATFVRKGCTKSACRDPFVGDAKHLNLLGRCLVTEHAKFIIFNIYAPLRDENTRELFYTALFKAIKSWREKTNKSVILCGDMNVTLFQTDRHFLLRKLNLKSLLVNDNTDEKDISSLMDAISRFWPRFERSLHNPDNVLAAKINTSAKRDRFGMKIKWADKWKRIFNLYDTPEEALGQFSYCFEDPDEPWIIVAHLECLFRSLGIKYNKVDFEALGRKFGKILTSYSVHSIVTGQMKAQKMEEVFTNSFGQLDFRFTCWNQSENRRFENIGSRIDYFIVDSTLLPLITPLTQKDLLCKCGKCTLLSKESGVCVSTLNQQYQVASFDGTGHQPVDRSVLLQHIEHGGSGFIYTPPSFSDHIAITMELSGNLVKCSLNSSCKSIARTQPFRKQRLLSQFFSNTKRRKID